MKFRHYVHFVGLWILLLTGTYMASQQKIGTMSTGFKASQMSFIDNKGLFLLSNNSNFGFGFVTTPTDVTLFRLVVIHTGTSSIIWTANRGNPVANSDDFVFDENGNAYLQKGGSSVWSSDTANKGVSAMELEDSGNLVLRGNDSSVVWQSFAHPTDTLISNQDFVEGMQLVSEPSSSNLSYILEIKSGDMILSAGFSPPQPYWSMGQDTRRTINENGGGVYSASFSANAWRFHDKSKVLLWQFKYSDDTNANATWIVKLGSDGFVTFNELNSGAATPSATKIPNNPCGTPQACAAYFICSGTSGTTCQCPSALNSRGCGTGLTSPCGKQKNNVALVDAGDGLNYFALGFVSPSSKTDLKGCKASCLGNCTCLAMFFDNSSGNCFLFDQIGSLQSSSQGSGFSSYIKVLSNGGNGTTGAGNGGSKGVPYVVIIIVVCTVLIICGLLFGAFRYYKKKKRALDTFGESSGEDNFLENLAGMPARFSFKDLQSATNNFSVTLGHGGFGTVYAGTLPDGTRIAVKKLEGLGQGKKEFRAEVSIIGSIHHHHLVRLRGFCAEGSHRMLAYEFMANGSLDKWIFRRTQTEQHLLDWETRFGIALGTAKGLAYLHEDCDHKIVHCDIKPENVLIDDHFRAKVSDFGLAKLMNREQSNVFTTLRGTRGYLAPEWLTSYAISEKSDVYSYGMLLLEIIAGRKNYDPNESSEKSHFPSYAFKMMEEGKLREILDSRLNMGENDERVNTAVKVALWCIQEDMNHRPSMTKVVQMLEGLSPVPNPPMSSPLGSRLYSGFFKSISEEGTSSGPSDCNSDAYLSAVRLSGPR